MVVVNGILCDKSVSIIFICGIMNIIGWILVGFLIDFFYVSSIIIYFVVFIVVVVINFFFLWCYNYLIIVLCLGVFGLCMGKFWV